MHRRAKTLAAGLAAVAFLLTAPGCVTKKLFRKNMDQTDSRIMGVESSSEDNERRLADIRSETDSRIQALASRTERAVEVGTTALSKAEQAESKAEQAARGKLLWTVTLSDDRVKFGFNADALSADAKRDLDGLSNRVKSMGKAVYLEIEGHTDDVGGESYNQTLGHKRAMAVLKYLNESGGIPLHAMNAISFGESKPVADNSTKDGRARNRRVVIRVLE